MIHTTNCARPTPAATPTQELPTTLSTCDRTKSRSRSARSSRRSLAGALPAEVRAISVEACGIGFVGQPSVEKCVAPARSHAFGGRREVSRWPRISKAAVKTWRTHEGCKVGCPAQNSNK